MISFYGRGGITSGGSGDNPNMAKILPDTKENWAAQRTLISEAKTIYVYTDYMTQIQEDGTIKNIPGIKIGDGTTYLVDLPFVRNQIPQSYLVSDQDRENWNNKVSATLSQIDDENLILFK